VLESELELLVEASKAIPRTESEYIEKDYMTNVLVTVLDIRMHSTALNKSIQHYRERRWDEIRTLVDLEDLLALHTDDEEGNRKVAQHLWGNNHWVRVEWLRGFVPFLTQNDLRTREALRQWARRSDFKRDFEGRVKYLGIASYKSLVMRLGVDTVKPDVHLHDFVKRVIGHAVTDEELVRAVEEAARRIGTSPRQLDASIWDYQRGGAGTF
jgi:hypothetical protein